jgi:kynurenine formamidase
MIYDLSQPIFNNMLQWPKFHPTSLAVPHFTATQSTNVERLDMPFRVPEAMDAGRRAG